MKKMLFRLLVYFLLISIWGSRGVRGSAEERYQEKLFKKNMEIAMLRAKVGVMSTLIGSSKGYRRAREKGKATTDFFKALNYLTGKKMIDAIESAAGGKII